VPCEIPARLGEPEKKDENAETSGPDTREIRPQAGGWARSSTKVDHDLMRELRGLFENFLATSEGEPRKTPNLSSDAAEMGSIFDTSFDLTEDRLLWLFKLFDEDGSGFISYDELEKGFACHCQEREPDSGKSQLDHQFLQGLIEFLDDDKSGDISFEEFSEGIRLLMLRSILQKIRSERCDDAVATEVFDYNSLIVERYKLEGIGEPNSRSEPSSDSQTLMDFFLRERREDITVRWINIAGKNAANMMKMMAVKYRLHPLALEDCLDVKCHRAKADSYDGHLFVIVPVFYLSKGVKDMAEKRPRAQEQNKRLWSTVANDTAIFNKDNPHIGVLMTSIFITKSEGRTVITFNNEQVEELCWEGLQSELRKSYSKLRQHGSNHLVCSLLDQTVRKVGPILKTMEKIIEHEREAVVTRNYKDMDQIHLIQTELRSMSRKIKPMFRLLEHVIEEESFSKGANIYLKDVLDNLEIYYEDLNQLTDACNEVDQVVENFLAKKTDRTLYLLTVISATFLPAQFFTGVWGMNFDNMPELNTTWGYFMFWGIAVGSMAFTISLLNFGRHTR